MQEQTDAQLGPLGQAVIDVLAPKAGERALDVGCGAGQTLLDLAERVGASGHVVGVDVSAPLVARARERVARAGLGHVEIVLADAATARFDSPFDLLFSRFDVMFFDDSVAGFKNLFDAVRPGGRLGFVCWQAMELNVWASAPLAAIRRLAPDQPLPAMYLPGEPGPFRFADPASVCGMLEAAGFARVLVEPREHAITVGGARTLEEAVEFSLQIGPAARFAAEADPALVPKFRDALFEALVPYAGERGVVIPAHVLVVTAARLDGIRA
jgi:ubiquinone/menaquinone biosynthesis C-methylase UbiE